jgi:ribose transport system permease protein
MTKGVDVAGPDLAAERRAESVTSVPADRSRRRSLRSGLRHASFTNIGVIYVEVALIAVFWVWAPDTFPTWTTARSVLNGSAIAGMISLAVVLPLSAQVFDLSVGNAMGLANMLVAWLLVFKGWGAVMAVILTLLAGLVMGVLNSVVVVGARIDSFIGTLATGSLFATMGAILSNQSITGSQLNGSFGKLATISLFGIELPLYLMLAVAFGLWFFQRYTVTGRRIYALGFNERGSELIGIRVKRLKSISLIVSAMIVTIAGVLLASSVRSGTPDIGSPYLLNAYAAAFLGSTQFGGRFNAWGTVAAVVLLETGTNGIYLVGGAPWAQSMFSGVVLLLALGASNVEQAIQVRSWIRAKAKTSRAEASGAYSAGDVP